MKAHDLGHVCESRRLRVNYKKRFVSHVVSTTRVER